MRNVLRSPDFQRGDIESERAGRGLSLVPFQYGGGIADIDQDRQAVQTGDNLAQDFEALAGKFSCLVGQAGEIAARARQTSVLVGKAGKWRLDPWPPSVPSTSA